MQVRHLMFIITLLFVIGCTHKVSVDQRKVVTSPTGTVTETEFKYRNNKQETNVNDLAAQFSESGTVTSIGIDRIKTNTSPEYVRARGESAKAWLEGFSKLGEQGVRAFMASMGLNGDQFAVINTALNQWVAEGEAVEE